MPRRRDSETGRYQQRYTADEIVNELRDTRLATVEVADRLGCHRSTAFEKLRELEAEGLVRSKQVGNTLIWESVD
jgi:GTP-sensing pleiotropic transcriptional regulator CodY